MKLATTVFMVLWSVACLANSATADEATPRGLLEAVRDAVPHVPAHAEVKLTSTRGWERQIELYGGEVNGEPASYIEVLGPQDVKDTRFLFFEHKSAADDQHIYIPLVKRAIKVGENTRKQAFLGSDFYVSDMVAPEIDHYDYAFVGEEELLGRKCVKIEAKPKDLKGEVYSKAIFVVDPTDKLLLKTYSYDLKGELLKIWTLRKVEKVDGIWTMLVHDMENVQDKTSSTIELTKIEYNIELPSNVFGMAHLLR